MDLSYILTYFIIFGYWSRTHNSKPLMILAIFEMICTYNKSDNILKFKMREIFIVLSTYKTTVPLTCEKMTL